MELGFVLPNNWGLDDARAVAAIGVEAEERGLGSVWVNHHVVNAGYIADRLGSKPYHDALTMLTWVAALTDRVKLGTSVLVLPYLHPMVLAKAIATLDQLSGGRVVAGVGVGSLPEENRALGVGYDDRGLFADEAIEVMTALWTSPVADHEGSHYAFRALESGPRPQQTPLPVWVGGAGGPARRRAARYGHGWHPMCSAEGLARRMPRLIEQLADNGRTRNDIIVAPRVDVAQISDRAAVEAYRAAGADQLVVGTSSGDLATIRAGLSHVASFIGQV